MKFFILAVLLVVVSAAPIPEPLIGADGRHFGQPYYYPYPGAHYSPAGAPNYPGPLMTLPGDFLVEQQPAPFAAPSPYPDPSGNPQQIQLLVSVPAEVPPGTSLSVTVNVNSKPSGATVVSVSNPVLSPAPVPVSAAIQPPTDAIVVDANKEPAAVLPDEFDIRNPPFENSKDSPFLVQMQEVALQQQLLASLLKNPQNPPLRV